MKKKNLMFVCACLLMSHAVSAQSKGEEIQFHRHGSLQLQGGAAYTLGEAGFGDLVSPAGSSWQLLFYPGVGTACRCVRL